jgi:hypothetical protein
VLYPLIEGGYNLAHNLAVLPPHVAEVFKNDKEQTSSCRRWSDGSQRPFSKRCLPIKDYGDGWLGQFAGDNCINQLSFSIRYP